MQRIQIGLTGVAGVSTFSGSNRKSGMSGGPPAVSTVRLADPWVPFAPRSYFWVVENGFGRLPTVLLLALVELRVAVVLYWVYRW